MLSQCCTLPLGSRHRVRLFLQGVCRVDTNEAPKATLSLVGVDQRSRPKVSSTSWFMREGLLSEWAVLTVPPGVITSGFGAKVHEGTQGGLLTPPPSTCPPQVFLLFLAGTQTLWITSGCGCPQMPPTGHGCCAAYRLPGLQGKPGAS